MYYLIYGIFYTLSLLPFWFLYLLSDGSYLIVYYIVKYRREVVISNLKIAFPEKTEAERVSIAKEFYKNFTDSFIETIKLLTLSKEAFDKRMSGNYEVVNNLHHTGQSVQLHSGHFFNWEFINLACSAHLQYPFIGVYMPVKNKIFDRLILRLRSRFGTILIGATQFRNKFHQYSQQPYALGLAADQNPGHPDNAYWHPFFSKLAPFVKGPEKGARTNNTAVVMVNFYRVKRGYYKAEFDLLTTTPKQMEEGAITRYLIAYIENAIRKRPSNYLWSHRRWKWQFNSEQGHLLI